MVVVTLEIEVKADGLGRLALVSRVNVWHPQALAWASALIQQQRLCMLIDVSLSLCLMFW